MPFKSEEQRRYMHANLPEIAQRWEQEYSNGGIMRLGYRYGGDTMGGPNDKSNQDPPGGGATSKGSERDFSPGPQHNPHTNTGYSGPTAHGPPAPVDRSAVDQFSQYGRNVMNQNLRGPTWGQRIGSGISTLGNMAGNYIKGGGMLGMGARMLSGIFGPSIPSTGNVGPAGLKNDGTYGTVEDARRALLRNQRPTHMPDGGDNIPFWAQLGYPSYDSWLSSQNQSIDNEDETGEGDFDWRFGQNKTEEERAAIEQMINEKFSGEEWDYDSFGLGDMDGS